MALPLGPWIGKKYSKGNGLLILSESTYCWPHQITGLMVCPERDHHSQVTVNMWGIEEGFHARGGHYSAKLTRALCGVADPTEDMRYEAWHSVAYMSFIQRPMETRWHRPTFDDMEAGRKAFLAFLEGYRPRRILVTGLMTWENMPDTQVIRTQRLQAYRRSDKKLSWCQAVPHPSSRKLGDTFRWREIAQVLKEFQQREDLDDE